MNDFKDFCSNFQLKDGDELCADYTICEKHSKGLDFKSGGVCFKFLNNRLSTTECILCSKINEKTYTLAEEKNIFTYLKDEKNLKNSILVICGFDTDKNCLYQICLTNLCKQTSN